MGGTSTPDGAGCDGRQRSRTRPQSAGGNGTAMSPEHRVRPQSASGSGMALRQRSQGRPQSAGGSGTVAEQRPKRPASAGTGGGGFADLNKFGCIACAPRWTIRGNTADWRRGPKTPGPGTYKVTDPEAFWCPRSPACTLKGSMRGLTGPDSPGPGTYSPAAARAGKRWTFSGATASSASRGSHTPGPGAYKVDRGLGGLRRTISAPVQPPWQLGGPGPGEYDPNDGRSGPRWGFGNAARGDPLSASSPGAGAYNPGSVNLRSHPRYSMGVKRDLKGDDIPGPGLQATQFTC